MIRWGRCVPQLPNSPAHITFRVAARTQRTPYPTEVLQCLPASFHPHFSASHGQASARSHTHSGRPSGLLLSLRGVTAGAREFKLSSASMTSTRSPSASPRTSHRWFTKNSSPSSIFTPPPAPSSPDRKPLRPRAAVRVARAHMLRQQLRRSRLQGRRIRVPTLSRLCRPGHRRLG